MSAPLQGRRIFGGVSQGAFCPCLPNTDSCSLYRVVNMPQKHSLPAFIFLLCLFFCISAQALAANPPEYERAKDQLAHLKEGKPGANSWQACADAFFKVYQANPKWSLRVAALFRCGIALEEKAKVTKSAADAKKAASVYEQAANTFPASALADDALFRAAVVYSELLKNKKKALAHLDRIAGRYSNADHAKIAEEYRAKMTGAKASSQGESSGGKNSPIQRQKPGKVGSHMLAAQLGLSVRTIILDPGHGGRDPGTMHNGVVERDVNLDVAQRLSKVLEKLGYEVFLTRSGNTSISLANRVRFGRRSKGDLFVSIHVNSAPNTASSGMETYILDFAHTSSASRLAMVENADSGRLGDMDKILTEILAGARMNESRSLAENIQQETLAYLKKNGARTYNGGVKGAPFFVLVGSSMPSVLIELGYCSNKEEAARLKTSSHRQKLAQGIANGIHAYAKSLLQK